jgi:crotonobetainyl-CoA:carnitine CoA-transferase CaiB-like acyl-CoA transferase
MIFKGLRVIDCGTYIAGPAAATMLSDFGAEVIKIERPPYGDPYRYLPRVAGMPVSEQNYCWILDDRNKKSIALDLSDPEAHQALLKLVSTADVFITNYQPQSLRKFRLTYEDLAPANDRLIHASITGYGEHGEDAEKPGYDATAYWARSGLMHTMHNGDAEPVQSPAGFGDHPTSVSLFASIVMALYQRQITGRGARVYTSLMANGIWSLGCNVQAALCGAAFVPKWTRKSAINPLVNHYVARDGRRMFLCLLEPVRDWLHLCQALRFEDLIDDERFSTPAARQKNSPELVARIDAAVATRDLDEWAVIFTKLDLVWGPVPSAVEVAEDPQAQSFFTELAPGLKTVQNPLNIEGIEKAQPRMAPGIGEHTREVLTGIGISEQKIESMIERGAAKCL